MHRVSSHFSSQYDGYMSMLKTPKAAVEFPERKQNSIVTNIVYFLSSDNFFKLTLFPDR